MTKRKKSRVDVHGPLAFVELTRGLWACIDAEDVPKVAGRTWYARTDSRRRTSYALTNAPGGGTVYLHRLLVDTAAREVDHANCQGLDNRRHNLRAAPDGENQHNVARRRDNTSGLKGVSWHRPLAKWRAQISHLGKRMHVGYFDTKEAAHAAFSAAARRLHGEFARTE